MKAINFMTLDRMFLDELSLLASYVREFLDIERTINNQLEEKHTARLEYLEQSLLPRLAHFEQRYKGEILQERLRKTGFFELKERVQALIEKCKAKAKEKEGGQPNG